jgi:hypothetical protein
MFIPDSGSDLFPSRIRTISIPDPESASNTKKTKKRFSAQENMVRVFHPRSRIRMLNFYPSWIPDKGVKNQIRGEKTFFFGFLIRNWDPGWKKFRSGIQDKHPGSATLQNLCTVFKPKSTYRRVRKLSGSFSTPEDGTWQVQLV